MAELIRIEYVEKHGSKTWKWFNPILVSKNVPCVVFIQTAKKTVVERKQIEWKLLNCNLNMLSTCSHECAAFIGVMAVAHRYNQLVYV